jgi:hypothetical protein
VDPDCFNDPTKVKVIVYLIDRLPMLLQVSPIATSAKDFHEPKLRNRRIHNFSLSIEVYLNRALEAIKLLL